MPNPFPFVAGNVLTAAQMNGIGEWTSYTPVLTASVTNPTLGTGGSSVGEYARIQNFIFYRFTITFGTVGVNAGSGSYFVSLPVTATAIGNFYTASVGQTSFFDSSANTPYFANGWQASTTNLQLLYQTGFNGAVAGITNVTPVTPAANDVISGYVIYKAA